MRKIYSFLFLAAVAGMSANAQQLPNGTFEGAFEPKAPWTSDNNTVYNMIDMETETILPMCSPASWTISNVIGMPSETTDGTPVGLGATRTGVEVDGYNSSRAIKLYNSPNSILQTQIVPGYMSLGTTWSTSQMGSNNDGGVWGGIEFTSRPDALAFYYKRERVAAPEDADESTAATYKPEEPTTIVAYFWTGSWTQKSVPGSIGLFTPPTPCDMVNRDRNILGMKTILGGDVEHTDDAALIAVLNTQITEDAAEWTRFVQPFEYKSDAAPAMANVILAAGDYFGGAEAVGRGNSLTVDDVMFVYYSRLASIKVGGVAVPDFKSDVYSYDLTGAVPAAEDVECELLGQGKTSKTAVAVEGNTVKVTVTNENPDVDGETSHVYTLNYKAAEAKSDIYAGYLNITMFGGDIAKDQPANIHIAPETEGKCTISLPNFSLSIDGGAPQLLGDIVVPGVVMTVAGDVTSYAGSVKGLSLAEGAIVADADVTGTTNAIGDADFTISVVWNNIPINVTFTGKKTSGIGNVTVDAEAPVEYYNINGMRVDGNNLQSGLYIRRQGNTVTKVLVK